VVLDEAYARRTPSLASRLCMIAVKRHRYACGSGDRSWCSSRFSLAPRRSGDEAVSVSAWSNGFVNSPNGTSCLSRGRRRTTVRIFLPARPRSPLRPSSHLPHERRRRSETILVVEDDRVGARAGERPARGPRLQRQAGATDAEARLALTSRVVPSGASVSITDSADCACIPGRGCSTPKHCRATPSAPTPCLYHLGYSENAYRASRPARSRRAPARQALPQIGSGAHDQGGARYNRAGRSDATSKACARVAAVRRESSQLRARHARGRTRGLRAMTFER